MNRKSEPVTRAQYALILCLMSLVIIVGFIWINRGSIISPYNPTDSEIATELAHLLKAGDNMKINSPLSRLYPKTSTEGGKFILVPETLNGERGVGICFPATTSGVSCTYVSGQQIQDLMAQP